MLLLGRIVAVLLSGALLAQSYGLNPFWPLAWLAPIPLLIAVMGASRWEALGFGALAGAASMALMFSYFAELSGPGPAVIITLIKALIWAGIALAVCGAARHLPAWAAVFVYPAFMAAIETLIATASPHATAGSLAYSQMTFAPALQVASLGGAVAITFMLSLFASAVAFLFAKRAFVGALVSALVIAAAIGWSYTRIPPLGGPGERLRVAMLAGDDYDFTAADWRPTWEAYAGETANAAHAGARILVLPEKIVTLVEGEAPDAIEQLASAARQYNAAIVVGAVAQEGGRSFNRAYLITANGAQAYDKHHMIPGYESHLTPGTSILFQDIGGVRVGVAICKDFDFPALIRRYGHEHVALMLAPAWDFERDAWLHSRMAVLRGVENGFTLVRSARNGVMTVSDPYGRVLADAPSGMNVSRLGGAIATPRHVPTLYTRIGDAFGWASAALALLLIGWAILARRRAGQGA
jgi:apolipoprotein N-acyltransferase